MADFSADFNYMLKFADVNSKAKLTNWYSKYSNAIASQVPPNTSSGGTIAIPGPRLLPINQQGPNGKYESPRDVKKRVISEFSRLLANFVPLSGTKDLVGAKEELTPIIVSIQIVFLPTWKFSSK